MKMSGNRQQLIDSLSDHVALFHASIPGSSSSSNPRNSVLDWFKSLTVHQRQAVLTVVDRKWTALLLQMQSRLRRNGHGFFIVLPDVDAGDPPLPTLCFRRSRGLLARVSISSSSEEILARDLLLFSSREGEGAVGSCSVVDTVTVSEDLLADFDGFVATMDGVSNGQFLRGTAASVATEWEELPWLKAKGYYSMESFVANKMELLLRYWWSNSRGRKRGVKVKSGENAAGIVENVLARKRGCIGWWNGLDERMKKQVFCLVSKKATKVLATESVSCRNVILKDIRCNLDVTQVHRDHIFPTWEKTVQMISHLDPVLLDVVSTSSLHFSLANCISGLILLQELSASLQTSHHEVETRTLFFSSLASVNTFSDCMLRRVRELLLRLSTDFIKFELLDDKNAKSQLNTSEEKSGAGHTKGKKKGCRSKNTTQRKQHSVSNSAACQKPYEDHGFKLMDGCNQSNILEATPLQFDATNKMHSAVAHDYARVITKTETNHVKGSSDREALNVHTRRGNASTKSKKRKPKSKRPFAGENNEEDNAEGCSQVSAAPAPAAAFKTVGEENQRMQLQPSGHDHVKDQNLSAVSNVSQSLNPSVEDNCVKEPEADATRDACEGLEVQCAVEKASHSFASYGTCRENPDKGEVSDCILTSDLSARHADVPDNHDSNMDSSFTPDVSCCYDTGVVSMGKLGTSACSGDDADNRLECSTGSYFPQPKQERFTQTLPTEETVYLQNIQDANSHTSVNFGAGTLLNRRRNVSHSPPLYTQSLPVVTDRLHLDVGCTSHNNFGESVISIDHTQNSSLIEDKNRIASSRAFSMSFDWPPYGSTDRSHPSLSHNFDSGQVPVLHPSEHSTFPEYGSQCNVTKSEDEKATPIYERTELCETKNVDLLDDFEGHWFSEEEYETRPIAERDYSQFFGGGVMYWNTSDLSGLRFSRPPSLSSDDSSWARHEADLNRTIDDIIGLPGLSSSYGTSGLASPPAPPFCTQYDSVGSGVQSVCYAMPGTEVNGAMHHSASIMSEEEKICLSTTNQNVGAVDGLSRDALPGPILRPIIIPNLSRKNSRSDFMVNLDHNSPCIPRSRKDYPRIKRPPSPVVLCVPRAPRPPPPSPVGGDSRKMRGFPAVRSGSSSPRHWGTKNMYADEKSHAEDNVCVDGAEKFWPTCAGKCLTGTPLMQPVPGNLLQDRLLAISQLSMDQEHPDVAVPVQSLELQKLPELKLSLASIHGLLHDEIDFFCKKVGAENMMRKPYINWAVKRVSRSLQVLWPRSRAKMFGSNATGLALPSSDVDLVVCLPPVRNLEPIKEAGILEGRNGIKETCLQHAARYLANQEWVKSDSLKTIENTAIPLIMLVAEVHEDLIGCDGTTIHGPRVEDAQRTIKQGTTTGQETSTSESSISTCVGGDIDESIDMKSIRLDISFQSTTHTGLQTTELVRELTGQFPAAIPLALVLKQFLADRSLDHSYSGGLSSYCLVLLITRFLQHQHHKGRPVNHNLGSLLMDFFYFFGNVFDPRQMRISIRGSGIYMDRERGQSLDPLHIEDPLYPTNNVGRNCFRIHQCIKAFSDAYNTLETETANLPRFDDGRKAPPLRLLPMIIPTINGI